MGVVEILDTMQSLHYLSILLASACVNADADATASAHPLPLRTLHAEAIHPFQGFGGSSDEGFYSQILPNLGVLHVNYRGNHKKGSGYIADFVYDGTGANSEGLATAGLSGYSGLTNG